MAARILVDTGAILALLDDSDDWHVPCTAVLPSLPLPLLTSEAVLSELFHLMDRERLEKDRAWDFFRKGVIAIAIIENSELNGLEKLMRQYKDRPMDFADATLIHLANRESISVIFTVDQNDFAAYRIGPRARFQLLPAEKP
jgi:predicted nucleic acid-binding protein